MPDEDIIESGSRQVLENMEISLAANVSRTAVTLEEFINLSLNSGVTPEALEAQLLTDLEQGGRIFGELRRSLTSTAHGTINSLRDIGQVSESGLDKDFRWVAVLVNTCPDCIRRHNMKPMSWEEWEKIGLPRTGQTVCKRSCRCVLVGAEFVDIIEPIKRPPSVARGERGLDKEFLERVAREP